jgi:hypothetical protein
MAFALAPCAAAQERWSLVQDKVLLDGSRAAALTYVSQLVVDPRGVAYTVDMASRQIFAVDSTGTILRQMGGSGDGPGQFRASPVIGLTPDGLWAADIATRRLTYFGASSRDVHTTTLQRSSSNYGLSALGLEGRLADGSIIYQSMGGSPFGPVTFVRGDTAMHVRDTIAVLGKLVGVMSTSQSRAPRAVIPQIQRMGIVVFAANGREYAVVQQSEPSADGLASVVIARYTAAGKQIMHRTIALNAEPLTSSDREELLKTSGALPGTPDGRLMAGLIENIRFMPAVMMGFLAHDGRLWLMRGPTPSRSGASWVVLDSGGAPIAELVVPPNVQIRAAEGDLAWGVSYDSDDVPSVIRYRIRH